MSVKSTSIPRIEGGPTQQDFQPPVVTVQIATLAVVVQQPMAVAEFHLLGDVVHVPFLVSPFELRFVFRDSRSAVAPRPAPAGLSH